MKRMRRGGTEPPRLSLLCGELLFEFAQRSLCVIRIDFPGFDRSPAGVEGSRKPLIGSAGIRCVVSRRQNELSQPCSDGIDALLGNFLAAGGSSKNYAKRLRHLLRLGHTVVRRHFRTSTGWNEEYVE
jgi:hypothetical protein